MTDDLQNIKFLFSRLSCPSGMVRERACVAIAELLVNSEHRLMVMGQLLQWMRSQQFESTVIFGQLILVYARFLNHDIKFPSLVSLSDSINKPSILSDMLMSELYSDHLSSPNWKDWNWGDAPEHYSADKFFLKYRRAFSPPIYEERSDRIGKWTGLPFMQQWAYEWQKITSELGIKPSTDGLDAIGRHDDYHYVAFDSKLSEVYRSAFLRALSWTVAKNDRHEYLAKLNALMACPIDIGLWRVKPNAVPNWWPTIDEQDGIIDTAPGRIWRYVQELLEGETSSARDHVIVRAGGRVCDGKSIYDLDIYGLFQIYRGGDPPDLENLVRLYSQKQSLHLNFLLKPSIEGKIDMPSDDDVECECASWLFLPAAQPLHTNTSPRWQFWRMYRGVWVPMPKMFRDALSVGCHDSGLLIYEGTERIARWYDWTDGLSEKLVADSSPATGQCLEVRRDIIEDYARETGSKFCWVAQISSYHRQYQFQQFKRISDYRHFGATNIIIP